MVRECRPPAREPIRSWLARRSTMATSTPAKASSPANISPVGPPPATTTAWSTFPRDLADANEIQTSQPPDSNEFWLRPAILRYDPGLAASPPMPYMLRVGSESRPGEASRLSSRLPRRLACLGGHTLPAAIAVKHSYSNTRWRNPIRLCKVSEISWSSARQVRDRRIAAASGRQIGADLLEPTRD